MGEIEKIQYIYFTRDEFRLSFFFSFFSLSRQKLHPRPPQYSFSFFFLFLTRSINEIRTDPCIGAAHGWNKRRHCFQRHCFQRHCTHSTAAARGEKRTNAVGDRCARLFERTIPSMPVPDSDAEIATCQ